MDVSVFLIEFIICNRIIINGNNMLFYKYEIFFKELDKVYFIFFVYLCKCIQFYYIVGEFVNYDDEDEFYYEECDKNCCVLQCKDYISIFES